MPSIQKDWKLDVHVPAEHLGSVINSALSGTICMAVRGERTNTLLCALPKSGSLHAAELIARSLDLANHQGGFDQRGGKLYWPRALLAKYVGRDTITHCHEPATPDILKMILALDLRVIVLTRNLLDALLSRRDMLVRDGFATKLLAPAAMDRLRLATPEAQIDAVIDLFAPDFLNFVASWRALDPSTKPAPTFLTYEELIRDEPAFVERVARAIDRACDPERVRSSSAAIAGEGGINRGVGGTGRGARAFAPRQIRRLAELAELHGCEDEAFLGPQVAGELRAAQPAIESVGQSSRESENTRRPRASLTAP